MTQRKNYCNIAARELGLDPAGYAGHFIDAVLIETPLPWKRAIYQEAGALPQEMIDLMAKWTKRYQETGVFDQRPLLIAPDEQYSQPGCRRVIYYQRPSGRFSRFDQCEYLVPEDQTGRLIQALFEAKETLSQFNEYLVDKTSTGRDILVCTHGTIDVACAKFGYPLYEFLRQSFAGKKGHEALRVWRVSHFGGHVFAPTLVDMPTGHFWAYVGDMQAAHIVERSGEVSALCGHYRGWAGLKRGFAQAAEREMWLREGWAWFDYAKLGGVISQDQPTAKHQKPKWADISITYVSGSRIEQRYHAHIEVCRTVETAPTTANQKSLSFPQYRMASLTQSG